MRVLLIAATLAAIGAVLFLEQDRLRGGSDPEDVAEGYVAAAAAGDTSRVLWLMPSRRVDPTAAQRHVERLRRIDPRSVSIEYIPNQIAGYIVTARISAGGLRIDELVLQKFGGRWYLVHFP